MASRPRDVSTAAAFTERSLGRARVATVVLGVCCLGAVGVAFALTPGDPFACRVAASGSSLACGWHRTFVGNLVTALAVSCAGTVLLGLVVGVPRATIRAARE